MSEPEMPESLREIWEELENEVAWLHIRWQLFRQVYAGGPLRIDLLNATARTFFFVLQGLFFDDAQLTLCKLRDPARTGKCRNLTLLALLVEWRHTAGPDDAGVVEFGTLVNRYCEACIPIEQRRNKLIAHFDHDAMLERAVEPLPAIGRADIGRALTILGQCMNCISEHLRGIPARFEPAVIHSGSDELIELLKRGLRYNELVSREDVSKYDLHESSFNEA
jgi:hypothetical protein